MIKGSRQNEGSLDHNKDEFDKNFDNVEFPKQKETGAQRREREKKGFLARTIINSWDVEEDGELDLVRVEELVEAAYSRCGGLDF